MAGAGSASHASQHSAGAEAPQPVTAQSAGGSAANDDMRGSSGAAPAADMGGSSASDPAVDPAADPAATARSGSAAPLPAGGMASNAAPVAGATAADGDAGTPVDVATDPDPSVMDPAAAQDSSVSPCRRDFEQCWMQTGDITGCASAAQPCGLFPDGPASAQACYDTMTSCFVTTVFDYPECIGRAEDCGLFREGARACALQLESCMFGASGETFQQCFMDATTCGLFPESLTAAPGGAIPLPGVPQP